MYYAHEAASVFCKNHKINDFHTHNQVAKMIDIEAQNLIDDGEIKGRNKWSRALDSSLEMFENWFNEGLEYHFDSYHDFVASHRRACVYAVLLRRSIEGLDCIPHTTI